MAYNGVLANSNINTGFMDLATAWKLEAQFLYGMTPESCKFGNPAALSYFVSEVKRSTWFTQIPVSLKTSNGSAQFGQEFSVTLTRIGEYLLDAWLDIGFPAVTLLPGNLYGVNGRLRWCRKPGHNLIEDCNITFNEQQVARIDNYILDVLEQFTIPSGNQIGYSKMIGDTLSLTGSHGPTTPLGATIPAESIILNLPFFFSRDSGVALPTASLLFNEIKINFKFRNWDQLLILDNSGIAGAGTVARAVPVVGRDIATSPALTYLNAWSTFVLVNDYERQRMAEGCRDMIIDQFQSGARQAFQPLTAPNPTYQPKFTFAVKALFFAMRNKTFANEWSNYTTSSPYNSGAVVNFETNEAAPVASNLTIQYENNTRLSSMPWSYFSLQVPYKATQIIPREIGYGLYSYSIKLLQLDANGSTNFSKLASVAINPVPSVAANIAAAGSGAAGSGADFAQMWDFINLAWSFSVINIGNGQLTFPFV